MEKKKCFLMYDGDNRALMPGGWFEVYGVYEFSKENSGEGSCPETGIWGTKDLHDLPIKLDQVALDGNFHEPVPDTLYLVRQYIDELPKHEYGVNDSYSLVGLFSDVETAFSVRDKILSDLKKNPDEDRREQIDVLGVTPNRLYEEAQQPFLGGGYYIE